MIARLSARARILSAALLIVGVSWCLDTFTGSGEPRAASAALVGPAAEGPLELSLAGSSAVALAERLMAGPVANVATPGELRDLFQVSLEIRSALSPAAPPPTESEQVAAAEPEPVLQGVVTGAESLALIGGTLYPRGAQVNGWRVESIRRDGVLLVRDGRQKWLTLPSP